MSLRRLALALVLVTSFAAGPALAQAGRSHAHDSTRTAGQGEMKHAGMHHDGMHHDGMHHGGMHAADSGFAALQARGQTAMGVDQYTSTHRFDDLPDGGRIELQRDPADTAGVRTIRAHLQTIARAFAAGDFTTPEFVHARAVPPGTDVMAARRDRIRYAFAPLPGGGAVRITTRDPEALRAVHAFLAFQRGDHRAGGTTAAPAGDAHTTHTH
ncbi:MAG TPA: hypothetical protein VFS40_09315 [Gemmatimonadales bacterium]|nr:hypothetical protein [Gemmatimonadales bacterium]